MSGHILVVDDEPSIRKVVSAQLRRDGYTLSEAADGDQALTMLRDDAVDVVLTDLRMPGLDGLALLRWTRQTRPEVPVIMLTAYGTVDTAVEAVKAGAFDFLAKPFDQQELRAIVRQAIATRACRADQVAEDTPLELLGDGPAVRAIRDVLQRVSATPAPVLIRGERGTGKEVVGRAIHVRSARQSAPLLEVHLSALPPERIAADLFGEISPHGALHPGRARLADGGTLLLADVDRLSDDAQVRLLKVLDQGLLEPLGGVAEPADVRIVALTDADLGAMVDEGTFSSDLHYRLSVVPLHLPALRTRVEDLPTLAAHLLDRARQRLGTPACSLTDEALARLASHHWPGNLRELETVLERAALLAEEPRLDAGDLVGFHPKALSPDGREVFEAPTPEEEGLDLKAWLRNHITRLERQRIAFALQEEDHNVTHAARRLGISRRSLQTKMKEYGLRETSPSTVPSAMDR